MTTRTRRCAGLAGTACAGVLALGLVSGARAHGDELVRSAGEAMLTYASAAHIDRARQIWLNGAGLHVLSGSTRDDVHTLLDVFDARCVRGAGDFAQRLEPRGRRALERAARIGHLRFDGVLRSDDDARGYVACFDLGGATPSTSALVERLRAYAASGDLSAIGDLRFVWAQRERSVGGTAPAPRGGAAVTAYVALWSEGRLPLHAMFPAHGDAPGVDLPGVPRPRTARRLLSAWQSERAPLLVSYQVDAAPHVTEAAYRTQLEAIGFRVQATTGRADARAWLLEHEQTLAIAVLDAKADGGTLLTLSPLE